MTVISNNAQPLDNESFALRAKGPRLSEPRVVPVEKDAWTPEQKQFLEPLEQSGNLYNVFTTIANHPELAREWWPFASYILRANSLSEISDQRARCRTSSHSSTVRSASRH